MESIYTRLQRQQTTADNDSVLFPEDFMEMYLPFVVRLLETGLHNTKDIYEFSAQYFQNLANSEERKGKKPQTCDSSTESHSTEEELFPKELVQPIPDFSYDSVLIIRPSKIKDTGSDVERMQRISVADPKLDSESQSSVLENTFHGTPVPEDISKVQKNYFSAFPEVQQPDNKTLSFITVIPPTEERNSPEVLTLQKSYHPNTPDQIQKQFVFPFSCERTELVEPRDFSGEILTPDILRFLSLIPEYIAGLVYALDVIADEKKMTHHDYRSSENCFHTHQEPNPDFPFIQTALERASKFVDSRAIREFLPSQKNSKAEEGTHFQEPTKENSHINLELKNEKHSLELRDILEKLGIVKEKMEEVRNSFDKVLNAEEIRKKCSYNSTEVGEHKVKSGNNLKTINDSLGAETSKKRPSISIFHSSPKIDDQKSTNNNARSDEYDFKFDELVNSRNVQHSSASETPYESDDFKTLSDFDDSNPADLEMVNKDTEDISSNDALLEHFPEECSSGIDKNYSGKKFIIQDSGRVLQDNLGDTIRKWFIRWRLKGVDCNEKCRGSHYEKPSAPFQLTDQQLSSTFGDSLRSLYFVRRFSSLEN